MVLSNTHSLIENNIGFWYNVPEIIIKNNYGLLNIFSFLYQETS